MKRLAAVTVFGFFFGVFQIFGAVHEVALTFDDGPHPKITEQILTALKQADMSATFFVIGKNVRQYPALARQIIASGCEIGNHTWSHLRHSPLAVLKREVEMADLEIKKTIGVSPKFFRFPYREETVRGRLIVLELGMIPVLWDIDPRDWKSPPPDATASYILSRVRPGSIILLHDSKENTLKALPLILEGLRERGLKSVTLSQLLLEQKPD